MDIEVICVWLRLLPGDGRRDLPLARSVPGDAAVDIHGVPGWTAVHW
jgi:hypothetical protein